MALFILLPLASLAVVCCIMAAAWLWGTRIHNASVVDGFWAFNFAVIAIITWFLANGYGPRKTVVCCLAALWGLRLGLYLAARIGAHLDEEEGRYKQLRRDWSKNVDIKFFVFFQAQAVSNVVLSIPFFIIALNTNPQMGVIEYIGAAAWLICIIGEAVADAQLKAFKNNPANKGKVCDSGLWNYSRHPNYFFQLMIWVAVFIFALGSPYGWLAAICPLVIGWLIFKVTGIPMTEEQSVRSRGQAYKQYQRTTSVFVPWFKKKP